MKNIKELFETVRDLAFKQMKFEQLPEEEQKKVLEEDSQCGLLPSWNEELLATYLEGRIGTAIEFWLDGQGCQLTDMQQAVLYAWRDKDVIDGWKVEDVEVVVNGPEALDFRVTIAQ